MGTDDGASKKKKKAANMDSKESIGSVCIFLDTRPQVHIDGADSLVRKM